jgi:hypothetical protein
LKVQPATTELIHPTTKCSKEKKEPLPDGIAEGGIDIGAVGGWVARDPCHGSEFDRYVLFKADVR